MRVAYDITVLGRGFIDSRSRTGIFRSIESLLVALCNNEKATLDVTALSNSLNLWDDILSSRYWQSCGSSYRATYVSSYSSRCNLKDLYTELSVLQKKIIDTSNYKNMMLYRSNRVVKYLTFPLMKADYKYTFKDYQYNIYHSTFFELPSIDLTKQLARVMTIHDIIPILYSEHMTDKIKGEFQRTIESINHQKDWIICNSENTKNDFCAYTHFPKEKVFVTPFAADDKFREIKDRSAVDAALQRSGIPCSPYILSLCTLEPRKNLEFLVSGFQKLLVEQPDLDLNLVLVGGVGWKNKRLLKILESSKILKSKVILTGYIPDKDLSAIYTGATAFIYPSLYEGFGLPPLEAMQCGTPVITSNVSSLPEVVGDAGITINPTDEDGLCQGILNLVQDSNLRAELSQKSLTRAQQFSWAKCAEQTIEVYNIAANNR